MKTLKIVITKKIGKATLVAEVEEPKEIDALVRASGMTTMPDKCTLCQNEDVELTSNKADKFTYAKVRCRKCGATSTMGLYQDGGGVFWKEFEKYQKPAPQS